MSTPQDSILVDSCQYTPVYLIQSPGAIQGRSFVVTQNHVEESKPVSDNLKRFYESSGLLEDNLVNNVSNVTKPRTLKKTEAKLVGNSLKFANFLVPKVENTQKQYIAVNNVVLKTAPTPPPAPPPPASTSVSVINGTYPRVEVDRKIVQMKIPTNVKIPTKAKTAPERILQIFPERIVQTTPDRTLPAPDRTLPKNRPKEITTSPKPTKHTSVQLLKLGETYHSINRLNDDQMKIVNQALKIFNNPAAHMQPTYDPVTNTRFIYKVVSPKDLTVVGNKNNKQLTAIKNNKKEKKDEEKKEKEDKKDKEERKYKEERIDKEERKYKEEKKDKEEIKDKVDHICEDAENHDEVKVTRSGRKVKFPKQIFPDDKQQKPRKKQRNFISCFQCSAEFPSLYRLQKHYQCQPTHIPAKIHANLFHCLLAIIKGGSEADQANIFIQQLEQLIEKLKSLLPCLLKKIDGSEGNSCNINDDIGRLFGMNPGKYNLNMDALACVKDVDGYCSHNPPPKPISTDMTQPSQLWLKHNEDTANDEDCARINAVDKWPTASKRLWKIKKKNSDNAKRKRLASDNMENAVIDLDVDDLIKFSDKNDEASEKTNPSVSTDLSAINITEPVQFNGSMPIIPTEIIDNTEEEQINDLNQAEKVKHTKIPHLQFHSTHFDIRSSPIKPSAAVFCKFLIDSEKIARYEAQAIRPLDLDKEQTTMPEEIPIQNNTIKSDRIEPEHTTDTIQTASLQTETLQSDVDSIDLQSILRDEIINLPCKDTNVSDDLSFDAAKDFFMNTDSNKSEDNFMKSNGLIEPSLIHIKDTVDLPMSNEINHDLDNDSDTQLLNQGHSVLNFLESLSNDCLSYPETDIRNTNIDFQLDLFSFHS